MYAHAKYLGTVSFREEFALDISTLPTLAKANPGEDRSSNVFALNERYKFARMPEIKPPFTPSIFRNDISRRGINY